MDMLTEMDSSNTEDLPELAQWFGPVKSTDLEPILTTNVSVSSDVLNRQINFIANYTKYTNENLDQLFFIINGLLVLLMQVGFACLEAGSIRAKNVTNIMLKNFLDSLICGIMFWLTGWAFAFGAGNAFIGCSEFAGIGLADNLWGTWFFQYTFASTTSTILSGALAERSSFLAYLSYSSLVSGVLYPIVVHWVWSPEGWLKKLHFTDFGGGMLIHGFAGCSCLIATIIIGPRLGRFSSKKNTPFSVAHSTALIGIGAIIILVGFCGFNAGTLNHFSTKGDGIACVIIVRNTLMSGAGGALFVLFASKIGAFGDHYWHFSYTINGGICGLVSSCAGCDIFSPAEAVITGFIAGLIYTVLHHFMEYLEVDDPLDSSSVHLGGGIWSVLSLPLMQHGGIFTHPIKDVLQGILIQMIGVAGILIWSLLASTILFGILHLGNLLRSSEEDEIIGMDLSKHNEPAYKDTFSVIPKDMECSASSTNSRISVICATSF